MATGLMVSQSACLCHDEPVTLLKSDYSGCRVGAACPSLALAVTPETAACRMAERQGRPCLQVALAIAFIARQECVASAAAKPTLTIIGRLLLAYTQA